MKHLPLTLIIYIFLPYTIFSQKPYEKLNNRISGTIGGNTAFFGIEFNHLFKFDENQGLSTGVGYGIADFHSNLSFPIKYYSYVSEKGRAEIGLAYTHFIEEFKYYEDDYYSDNDVIFFLLEYSQRIYNTRLEYTVGLTPLYELNFNEFYLWGSFRLSFLFETKKLSYNPFRFKKRYKLNTARL